ncbi:hypothetical protein PFISCL1PPCAC_10600 [Pristionchus fissidentatus]|uniref:Uncharacterized protein n=1 Tax=Pristionchus fissidentatus TaxID=1538716 RepID=A0AAV5VLX4_9BILA|nr:hypothetical protein PFISCL1PPCAC_10600 [Pristionchus fissidentatus]
MLGWFSAFRENGAPTSYGEQRTPVLLDTQIFGLVCLFAIPSLAFLIILPGVRHTKAISSLVFLCAMAIGTVLIVGLHYPTWHVASGNIDCPYKAFSKDRIKARIDVRIGLHHVNISLCTDLLDRNLSGLLYNERFDISEVHLMEKELSRALTKGLPFPILKVVEYLSLERCGFHWGRMYRVAGHYTSAFLWLATACWILSMTLLCLSPSHFATSFLWTGILILTATAAYIVNVPQSMEIRFPSSEGSIQLMFTLGHSFYASLFAGTVSVALSLFLMLLRTLWGYELDTVFTARRKICKSWMTNKSLRSQHRRKISVYDVSRLY